MKNLYLFSEMFPFGNHSEIAFLQNEISYLTDAFNKVTIIPYGCSEKLHDFSNSVLSLADVDLSLKRELGKNKYIARLKKSVLNRLFFKEIVSRKGVLFDKIKLKRLLSYLSRAKVVEGWFKRNINSKTDQSTNLLYTFWNNEITLGLANAVQNNKNCKIISRAHAHDLYENESFIGYIPCYKEKLRRLNRIYPVSNEGSAYLNNKYPGFENKIKTRYLGVSRAKAVCQCSVDSIIRIVSSSYSIHRKRIDLLMNGIHAFSKKYHQKVIYHHFGDGPRQSELKDLALILKSENFEVNFHGFVPNNSLLNYYANRSGVLLLRSAVLFFPSRFLKKAAYFISKRFIIFFSVKIFSPVFDTLVSHCQEFFLI